LAILLFFLRPSVEGNDSTINSLDEWLNVLQSFQLPFALLPVMHFTSSEKIMGPVLKNSLLVNIVGWTATVVCWEEDCKQ
jgi:Mn2+/Fe2+ NRAMP family transporter